MLLAADDIGLNGAWFAGQKYFANSLETDAVERNLPVFDMACLWMDVYFTGNEPGFDVPLHLAGTEFQRNVWALLSAIPYGTTVTYGDIARRIHCASAQAVGSAVGRNPVSIFVPCHRVIGKNGTLTGYAGGIDKKIALLQLEGINL